jgi:hypothetical protein
MKSDTNQKAKGYSADGFQLDVITPLAKKIVKRIAEICIHEIPNLIGAKLASLYILDESSDILHLEKNNHPFLINNIVSLNQNPPSPMVAAVRSKELLVISDVETHKTPNHSVPFPETIKQKRASSLPWFVMGGLWEL